MTLRFRTEADLQAALGGEPKRSKYGNRRVEFNGQKFDSLHELKVWQDLKRQETAGLIRAVIRQVSFPLGNTSRRIRVDFLVIDPDGRYRWLDAKGMRIASWELKRDMVRDAYGIEVELVG